jgi:hypothetical protein
MQVVNLDTGDISTTDDLIRKLERERDAARLELTKLIARHTTARQEIKHLRLQLHIARRDKADLREYVRRVLEAPWMSMGVQVEADPTLDGNFQCLSLEAQAVYMREAAELLDKTK